MEKMIECPRCCGKGIIDSYKHVQGGICFECHGKGMVTLEEYDLIQKSMMADSQKIHKKSKNQNDRLLKDLKKSWFNNREEIYVVNLKNTYPIKDELKNAGAKFVPNIMIWIFESKPENYDTFLIKWSEIIHDGQNYALKFKELIHEKSNGIL